MKKFIKKISRKFGIELSKYTPDPVEQVVSLKPETKPVGNVILSLWVEPFLLKDGKSIPNGHAHNWRSTQIAKIFLDLGYNVDVIDYRNTTFVPEKQYAVFIAFRTNFERIAKSLNHDCIKIVHLDTAHWLFNNSASLKRGLDLQSRKGVTLEGLRIVEPNLAIEYADYATVTENHFTGKTYSYLGKPLFSVPYPACAVYPWQEQKDFASCRKTFLWFGSQGFVHKGLDLVLDAFADMPEHHLYVCGPIQKEADFEKAYHKELYQTPNIHTIGWVDMGGPEFVEVTTKCIGIIYPSCSEGGPGSVLQCIHAGLIPVVSHEAGVDVHDFGVILKDCSINTIKSSLREISELPVEELSRMSRRAWEFARENHTRERFVAEYRKTILKIMEKSA